MALEWRDVSKEAKRPDIWHISWGEGLTGATLALSREPDGWYWGVFSYATDLRISDDPKPYTTCEEAEKDAEAWLATYYPEVLIANNGNQLMPLPPGWRIEPNGLVGFDFFDEKSSLPRFQHPKDDNPIRSMAWVCYSADQSEISPQESMRQTLENKGRPDASTRMG